MQRSAAVAQGIGVTRNNEELSLDWFDAIALSEDEIDALDAKVNQERALAKAMASGGKPR